MNALTKENPSDSSYATIHRGFNDVFKGCFALQLGHHNTFFAKLYAVILIIEVAFRNGWHQV